MFINSFFMKDLKLDKYLEKFEKNMWLFLTV